MFNNSDFRAMRDATSLSYIVFCCRENFEISVLSAEFVSELDRFRYEDEEESDTTDQRTKDSSGSEEEALWPRWHLERFPISPESIHLVRDVTVLRTWLWSTKLGSQTRLTSDYSRRGRIRVRAYLCVRNEKKRVAKRRNFDTESSTVKNTTDINCKALQGTSLSREIARISHGIEFNDTAHTYAL